MLAISEEEATKLSESIGVLASSISHLQRVHSSNLKLNAKVCWYLKCSKDRQDVLKHLIEEMNRNSADSKEK